MRSRRRYGRCNSAGRDQNHIDFATLVAVITLMLLSPGIVYSASSTVAFRQSDDSEALLFSHLAKVVVGLGVLFLTIRFDYHRYRKFTKTALLAAIGLLVVTFIVGAVAKGAVRWIRLGPLGIQPSEFAKYALLFHICTLISTKGEMIRDFRKGFVPMMVWIGVVTLLVVLQPNFSMASMIGLLTMVMLFIGGVRLKHLALTAAPAIPVMPAVLVMEPYRVRRIESYLQALMGEFSAGAIVPAPPGLIAFGRGGIFGTGRGQPAAGPLFRRRIRISSIRSSARSMALSGRCFSCCSLY